ncbi:hypothetical protein GCM10010430_50820 [Kitasatospora cystarginea]|uniref:SnoaL-like domain-containing protein n=1 Tax=Kitasatospora cystarginea TaxID=58350 RepID=A0ABN3EJA6_9ACTN
MNDFQEIADRVEIEALRGEFTDAAMMRGRARLAALFTPDGVRRPPRALASGGRTVGRRCSSVRSDGPSARATAAPQPGRQDRSPGGPQGRPVCGQPTWLRPSPGQLLLVQALAGSFQITAPDGEGGEAGMAFGACRLGDVPALLEVDQVGGMSRWSATRPS